MLYYRLTKIVRCSNNDDSVTIRASDSSDHVTLLFESPSEWLLIKSSVFTCFLSTDQDRVSEYEMKLMDIDSESVAIPVSVCGACVR